MMRSRRIRGSFDQKLFMHSKSNDDIRFLVLGYVTKLLNVFTPTSEEFFACLDFALKGFDSLREDFQLLLEQRIKRKSASAEGENEFYSEKKIKNNKEVSKLLGKISLAHSKEMFEEIKFSPKNKYPAFWEEICNDYSQAIEPLLILVLEHCKNELSKKTEKAENEHFKTFAKYFSCSRETVKLVELIYTIQSIKCMESYFEDEIDILSFQQNPLLCHVLDIKEHELNNAFAEANISSFIDKRSNYRLSDTVVKIFQSDSKEVIDKLFYSKLNSEILPLDKFTLEDEQKDYILRLLSSSSHKPVHILLYGAPGTGKTCFAKSLAAEIGYDAWSITSREEDKDVNRRTSLVACRQLMQGKENTFIVVDEAERLLDTDRHNYEYSKDKAWLNAFLEKENSKIIWISNEVDSIDQAVRRRFSYSVHFKDLTKEQRIEMWQNIIKKERVSKYFKKEELEALVEEYDVSVASISAAIQQTKQLGYNKADFLNAVRNYLDSYIILSNDGLDLKEEEKLDTTEESYTLDGVSLEDSSKTDLPLFMERIKKIDNYLKTNNALPPNAGTMLFYGPPGTGKSALAKHIAKEIGRKCIFKRASDIFGMFVGENEKNIRQAFDKAEKENAVLVFDEADSFIFSRESASKSWETNTVNEFLTSLEKYKGICICTTNHRGNMDSAAMRRFAFKIGFTYAKDEQIISLYETILAPLVKGQIPTNLKNPLLACKFLTAGDFAAVRSQFWLYEKGELSHKEIVEALMKEQNLKLEAVTKKIGF